MSETSEPAVLGERFDDALRYAHAAHRSQMRKGTDVPYVSHLLAVASLVLEDGGAEDDAIAALLHDAAEDQGGRERLEDIRRRFGEHVAEIVDGCTDAYEDPKPAWRERKEEYVARVRTKPSHVVRVSLADKLHNARAILADYRRVGERVWDRFNADRDSILWYYRSLLDAFKERSDSFMVVEFEHVVDELTRLGDGMSGPSPR